MIKFETYTSSFGNEGSKGMRMDASCQRKSQDSANTLNKQTNNCQKCKQVNFKQYKARADFMHTFRVLYNCLTAATRSAEGVDSSVNVCSIFKMRTKNKHIGHIFIKMMYKHRSGKKVIYQGNKMYTAFRWIMNYVQHLRTWGPQITYKAGHMPMDTLDKNCTKMSSQYLCSPFPPIQNTCRLGHWQVYKVKLWPTICMKNMTFQKNIFFSIRGNPHFHFNNGNTEHTE